MSQIYKLPLVLEPQPEGVGTLLLARYCLN